METSLNTLELISTLQENNYTSISNLYPDLSDNDICSLGYNIFARQNRNLKEKKDTIGIFIVTNYFDKNHFLDKAYAELSSYKELKKLIEYINKYKEIPYLELKYTPVLVGDFIDLNCISNSVKQDTINEINKYSSIHDKFAFGKKAIEDALK